MEGTEAVEPVMRDGWVTGGSDPAGRRARRGARHGAGALRRRGRRRGQPIREARRRPARRDPAARDRGPPLLPGHLSPRAVVRVVAGPVGGRPAAARLRVAVPGRRRSDQPRRRSAQHVQGIQGHLRAAAVQRLRDDAARGVGHLRGDGGGTRPVGATADEPEPGAAGRARDAAGRRRRRRREPVQRRGHRLRDGVRRDRRRADPRLARAAIGPVSRRATPWCCGSDTGGTSRSGAASPG